MDSTLQRKLEQCGTLPTLPAVALRIVQLCQAEDPDVPALLAAVADDPALAAKVLKLVNSAAFGRRQEVRTLSHAVILLGTNALRALALSFSLVPDPASPRRAALGACWKRSLVSAIAARELALVVGFPLGEDAFLCALLQDLGMLALGEVLGVQYQAMLAQAGDDHETLAAHERVTLGTDHAEVGAWLLERWRLPRAMGEAARLSHAPGRLAAGAEPETATLVRITAAAGLLADVWTRANIASATERARLRACGLLGLSGAAFEALLGRIADALPELGPLFEVDLGRPEDCWAVAEAAKETLVALNLRASERIDAARRTIRALEDRAERLAREAERDPLTGLYNRRYLETYLEEEFSIAFHTGAPLTVMLGDVDQFKALNDVHGHLVGDQIIRDIAAAIGERMRPQDVVGRYGGEEFLVILPNTPAAGAAVVADRMRLRIEALELHGARGEVVRTTMSFGHATMVPGAFTCYAEVLRAADDALYAAKRAGRNRVAAYALGPAARVADGPAGPGGD